MIGTIGVEGLKIECIVGIYPHERETPQDLIVDAELDRDFAAAADGDSMDETVDYVAIADGITNLAVAGEYRLIETFAEDAARFLLERFDASRAAVKVMKPAAIPAAKYATVRVERRR